MRNHSSYDSLVLVTVSQNVMHLTPKNYSLLKESDGSPVAPVCAGSLLAAQSMRLVRITAEADGSSLFLKTRVCVSSQVIIIVPVLILIGTSTRRWLLHILNYRQLGVSQGTSTL